MKSLSTFIQSRATLLLACVCVVAVTILFYAGAKSFDAFLVLSVDGPVTLLWFVCAGLIGAIPLHWLRMDFNRPLFVSAATALGLGIFSLLILGMGLAGIANQTSIITMLGLSAVLGLADWYRAHRAQFGPQIEIPIAPWLAGSTKSWLVLLAAPAVGAMLLCSTVLPGWLWRTDDPQPYDVLLYHLQIPREWFELGRIVPLKHNVFSFFPFNVEMHYLGLMHLMGSPFRAMYCCQMMSLGYLLLAALAVWNLGDKRISSPIGAIILLATPFSVMLGSVCYVEPAMLLYSLLAILFLIRAINSDSVDQSMLLAGIFAGLAGGVKYTAVPMVFIAGAIGFAMVQNRRMSIRGLIIFTIAGSAALSPWLIRNWIWAGNPVFPLAMKTLGHAHFSAGQIDRFIAAHSAPAEFAPLLARLARTWSEILAHWKFALSIIPCALAAGLAAMGRKQNQLLLLMLVAMLLVWLFATHLIGRFYYIALAPAAVLVATSSIKQYLAPLVCAGIAWAWILGGMNANILNMFAKMDDKNLVGLYSTSALEPPEIEPWLATNDVLCKVGDAQIFLHNQPMSRIRYRSPFDVDSDHFSDPVDAWVGNTTEKGKIWLMYNPTELRRLNKTYGIPLPRDIGNDDAIRVVPPTR